MFVLCFLSAKVSILMQTPNILIEKYRKNEKKDTFLTLSGIKRHKSGRFYAFLIIPF